MSRRSQHSHRRRMTRYLVEALKEKGELGKVLETEPMTKTERKIIALVSQVNSVMRTE